MSAPALKVMTASATTSLGEVALLLDRAPETSRRPVVLMIHGALRHSDLAVDWFPILADYDLVLADLPGHGRSPGTGPATVAAIATRLKEVIARHFRDRSIIVVGESIGGVIGLALADGSVRQILGVVALDPPLTMAKQWPVYANIIDRFARYPDDDYLRVFAFDIFGIGADGSLQERIYYDVVRNVRVPALVLAGDIPLWPVSRRTVVPSLLDEADRHVIRQMGNAFVSLRTVHGAGHLYLAPPDAQCSEAILEFCAARLAGDDRNAARQVS